MNSLLVKVSDWHSSLSPIQKVGVAGVAITASLLSARGVQLVYRKFVSNEEEFDKDDGIDKTDPTKSSYLYRLKKLSFHSVFWGSYLLNTVTWAFTLKPEWFNKLPRIYHFGNKKTLTDLLPPIPNTMLDAFKLGQLENKLTNEELNKSNINIINNILNQASKLINKENIILTSKQLHLMKDAITESENEKSLMNRTKSIFNFVNVMWLFSIMGISATIIPVIYYTLKPFQNYLMKFGKWIKHILINPTAFRVYEVNV